MVYYNTCKYYRCTSRRIITKVRLGRSKQYKVLLLSFDRALAVNWNRVGILQLAAEIQVNDFL